MLSGMADRMIKKQHKIQQDWPKKRLDEIGEKQYSRNNEGVKNYVELKLYIL